MGASAAAGHVAGCWHHHPMPSFQGGPFHSAAAGWAAGAATAPRVEETALYIRACGGSRSTAPQVWGPMVARKYRLLGKRPHGNSGTAELILYPSKGSSNSWKGSPSPHTLYSSWPLGCRFCTGSKLCRKFMLGVTCRKGVCGLVPGKPGSSFCSSSMTSVL